MNTVILSPIDSPKIIMKTYTPTYDLFPDQSIDLNRNQEIRNRITHHFYRRLYKYWIKNDMLDVLKYFVMVNGQIQLVKSKADYQKNTIGLELIDQKVEYIMKHFLTQKAIQRLLFEIVTKKSTQWWTLMRKEHKDGMKKVFRKFLLHLIEKSGASYHKGGNSDDNQEGNGDAKVTNDSLFLDALRKAQEADPISFISSLTSLPTMSS